MRHLPFPAIAIGIFAAIDAIQFKSENRAALSENYKTKRT